MNRTCQGCRLGRCKCDMTITPDGVCSRCKRLGMTCVAEIKGHAGGGKGHGAPDKAARASARARLSEKSRALLCDEDDRVETNTATELAVDVSQLGSMLGTNSDEAEVCNMLVQLLADCDVSGDRLAHETQIRMLILISHKYDHCGLLSFAMQKAQQLGFPLSRFSSALDSTADANYDLQLIDAPPPPECLMDILRDQRYPSILRTISNGRLCVQPNETFCREVSDSMNVGFSRQSPLKPLTAFLKLVHPRDKHIALRTCRRAMRAPVTKMDASKPESQDVCAVNLPQMSNACELVSDVIYSDQPIRIRKKVSPLNMSMCGVEPLLQRADEERKDEAITAAIAVPEASDAYMPIRLAVQIARGHNGQGSRLASKHVASHMCVQMVPWEMPIPSPHLLQSDANEATTADGPTKRRRLLSSLKASFRWGSGQATSVSAVPTASVTIPPLASGARSECRRPSEIDATTSNESISSLDTLSDGEPDWENALLPLEGEDAFELLDALVTDPHVPAEL